MEVSIAEPQAWMLRERLSMDHAEGRAWSRKMEAFGTLARVTGFLHRPKDNEFELTYKEHRFEPYWQLTCASRYVYERTREYTVHVDPVVTLVTINGVDHGPVDGTIAVSGREFCREEHSEMVYVDGLSNVRAPELARYAAFEREQIAEDKAPPFGASVVIVPPRVKASTVVRDALGGLIRSVDADSVAEDQIEIRRVDLCYRPVYAFEYAWKSRDRAAVMEFDGLTGELRADGQVFRQYVGKLFDPNLLFDIGADTASLLIPGGGLGLKVAKWTIGAVQARAQRAKMAEAAAPAALPAPSTRGGARKTAGSRSAQPA
jgi:hypothetical protein